jgi:hypothetical protein
MIKKLIALDLRTYRAWLKWALPIYLLLQISALAFKGLNIPALGGIAHVIAIIATALLIPIALLMGLTNYYRSFYTNQGYLTHTLPVTPGQRYHAKLFSGFILYAAATILTLAGAIVAVLAAGLAAGTGFQAVSDGFRMIGSWPYILGLSPVTGWLLAAIVWVLIYLDSFAVYSFCISLGMGRRLARYGIGGPFLVYLIYYIVDQIGGLVSFLFIPLSYRFSFINGVIESKIVTVMPFRQLREIGLTDNITDNMSFEEGIEYLGHVDFGLGIFIFMFAFMIFSYFFTKRQLGRVNLR